jgi:hypothetical protein
MRAKKRAQAAKRKARDPEAFAAQLRAKRERLGNTYAQKWARENPERAKAAAKRWRRENKEKLFELHLRDRCGIDLETYKRMWEKQAGLCAICRSPERAIDRRTTEPRRLAVDHCHRTGVVRGLLCYACNVAIGLLKDRMDLLESAILYLEKSS